MLVLENELCTNENDNDSKADDDDDDDDDDSETDDSVNNNNDFPNLSDKTMNNSIIVAKIR